MAQVAALTYALRRCGFSNRGRKGTDHRVFLSAVVYLGKTGCQWINLPQVFGKYKSVHSRFSDWSRRGVFEALFESVRNCDDKSVLRFVDTSFVKCSICSLTGRCSQYQRVTGKTKGGFERARLPELGTRGRMSEWGGGKNGQYPDKHLEKVAWRMILWAVKTSPKG